MLYVAIATLVILWIVHALATNRKWAQLPSPGFCFPLIGHLHLVLNRDFTADPVNALWKLYQQKQQAGMLWMRALNVNTLFVGDYQLVRHLFNLPEMQLRDNTEGFKFLIREERDVVHNADIPGVLISNGATWSEQRRFTLRALRDFGFGKASMEEMIHEEVLMFLEVIKKAEGEPFDFGNKFNLPILNALWRVTVGTRFDYDDPKLISIVERLTAFFQRIGNPAVILIIAFPWITKIFPKFLDRDQDIVINKDIIALMTKCINEHEETIDQNEPRDLIDKVLIEIGETTSPDSSFYGNVGKENLANTLMDLFLAGSETTSTTLTWAVLLMVRHPQAQSKVQSELDSVVGRARLPSLSDRPGLPYTEAVLAEIQRYANIVPQGVAHCSNRDVTVQGVTIPAGTLVIPLMAELLKGSYWKDGTQFRPERFLDSDGNFKKDDHLIPFSIGKRQCLGETLAKVELFLFFTGILHTFILRPEVEGHLPKEEYTNGATILPKPFRLRLTTRA